MADPASVATKLVEVCRQQFEAAAAEAWDDVTCFDSIRWRLLEELAIDMLDSPAPGVVEALEQARVWSEACALQLNRAQETMRKRMQMSVQSSRAVNAYARTDLRSRR